MLAKASKTMEREGCCAFLKCSTKLAYLIKGHAAGCCPRRCQRTSSVGHHVGIVSDNRHPLHRVSMEVGHCVRPGYPTKSSCRTQGARDKKNYKPGQSCIVSSYKTRREACG